MSTRKTQKTPFTPISSAEQRGSRADAENAPNRAKSPDNRRFYLITSGDYDSYRIEALVSGPKTPALSTMRKRFSEQFSEPKADQQTYASGYLLRKYIHEKVEFEDRVKAAGYANFTDWLIKQDEGFELVKYQEVGA